MYHFMTRSFRNSPTPSDNRLIAFPKISQLRPGIRTRLARTECHRSITCATTTAIFTVKINRYKLQSIFTMLLAHTTGAWYKLNKPSNKLS